MHVATQKTAFKTNQENNLKFSVDEEEELCVE